METHGITIPTIFFALFLLIVSLTYRVSKKASFLPFTVLLLLLGLVFQYVVHLFGLHLPLELSHEVIYFVLLPLLLFESSFHINFHQFRLQFKTITFVSTVGLLLSVFAVGFVMATLLGLPFDDALLFGAIISATDPIAVITLFKNLGAPRRLTLLADGESMFNDATGVIAFRIISAIALAPAAAFTGGDALAGLMKFLYMFVGSIVFGAFVGYLSTYIFERIRSDKIVVTALTAAIALGSFVASELFFGLSGVITAVAAGIVIGNLGRTKISSEVRDFEHEFWEFLAFVSVSLVFFFATFTLDLSIFSGRWYDAFVAIIAVLIARSISVYLSFFISNKTNFFKEEPNVPLSWQHILNWGGLRGVIPLVLVNSLPSTYEYYDEMVVFTLSAFLFTLFVNGLTIRNLLMKLNLHVPKIEEEMINEEKSIFDIDRARNLLTTIPEEEVDRRVCNQIDRDLLVARDIHVKHLLSHTNEHEIERCLRIGSIEIERDSLEKLFHHGYINEDVYYEFDTELDLQEDALEYPEVYTGRNMAPGGKVDTKQSYRNTVRKLRKLVRDNALAKLFLKDIARETIEERIGLLKARIITSEDVISYFEKLKETLSKSKVFVEKIKLLMKEQEELILKNRSELAEITNANPKVYESYQQKLAFAKLQEG